MWCVGFSALCCIGFSPFTAAHCDGVCVCVCGGQAIDKVLAGHIKSLWADPGIKNTFAQRSKFQLDDACQYFFDGVEAMAEEGFIPTYQDVLRCRARTTVCTTSTICDMMTHGLVYISWLIVLCDVTQCQGIVETEFVIEEYQFKMLDVGGQRNERY